MPPMLMAHESDPRDDLFQKLGNLSSLCVMHNNILVATYIRPTKTKSGIYLTDGTQDEDKYQGKVGLVVKMGPQAFVDDEKTTFKGQSVEVGDWIFFRPSDGWPVTINGVACRMLDNEFLIRGKIGSPDQIY